MCVNLYILLLAITYIKMILQPPVIIFQIYNSSINRKTHSQYSQIESIISADDSPITRRSSPHPRKFESFPFSGAQVGVEGEPPFKRGVDRIQSFATPPGKVTLRGGSVVSCIGFHGNNSRPHQEDGEKWEGGKINKTFHFSCVLF